MRHETPWELRRRGMKDARRHDERVKEAIRKNLRRLIVEETIISSDGRKTVRIPVRYLDQYRFRYSREERAEGVGQGSGDPGDVIARRSRNDAGDGEALGAGALPGEAVYEAEVELEEIVSMMLDDLKLPLLENTPERTLTAEDIRFDDIRRKGMLNNLDKRRTLLENLKRQAAKGRRGLGRFDEGDLRFKTWEVRSLPSARAAVYMLMDRSASMTMEKRYIAKSFFFWLTQFLKLKYRDVDLVFIAHDAEAEVVGEQEFFTVSASGGTCSSSAYRLALQHMREVHPPSRWNAYVFHFTDGENWPEDNELAGSLVDELLEACRRVGYGEILYSSWARFYAAGNRKERRRPPGGLYATLLERSAPNLVLVQIDDRDEIYEALRTFLAEEA